MTLVEVSSHKLRTIVLEAYREDPLPLPWLVSVQVLCMPHETPLWTWSPSSSDILALSSVCSWFGCPVSISDNILPQSFSTYSETRALGIPVPSHWF